jgi:hypothetical protein
MPCVGFESTIPASERAKTLHALDRSATVTGSQAVDPGFLLRNPQIHSGQSDDATGFLPKSLQKHYFIIAPYSPVTVSCGVQ